MGQFLRSVFVVSVLLTGHVVAQPLPVSVDNSRSPYFPPQRYQGNLGSCDWFACAYYQMTYMYNRALSRPANPTNTFSPAFGFSLVNNGGTFPNNLWFADVYDLLKDFGSPSIADFPYDPERTSTYKAWCTNADLWRKALRYRIEGGEALSFDIPTVKKLLADGEVLVIQCNPWSCGLGTSGDNPASQSDDSIAGMSVVVSGPASPDHTVALVGYDDTVWVDANGNGKPESSELGAFRIIESAQGAGEREGYRWVAYRAVSDPSSSVIFENKVWRMKIRKDYKPKVLVEIRLRDSCRGRLNMQFGRSTDADENTFPSSPFLFDPKALGFSPGRSGKSLIAGADWSFAGSADPGYAGFVFDLSDLVTTRADGADIWFFRLRNDSKKSVSVVSWKLIDLEQGVTIKGKRIHRDFSGREVFLFLRHPRAASTGQSR